MKSARQQWVLDVQWSDAPAEVIEEVRKLWRERELGNDSYIYKFGEEAWSWDSRWSDFQEGTDNEVPTRYPAIQQWLLDNNVPFGEDVWIHWWW